MANPTRTFRVFVSSTFSDLKAERNALQAYVFPRLREFCEKRGSRFQPIDLRWGVSDEASLDQQAMNICLAEIERCRQISPRPNFIVLLIILEMFTRGYIIADRQNCLTFPGSRSLISSTPISRQLIRWSYTSLSTLCRSSGRYLTF